MYKEYEHNSYAKTIVTTVTGSETREDGEYINLADVIFFPEEGGQYADTGIIEYDDKTVYVLDGIISGRDTVSTKSEIKEETIAYRVSEKIAVGTKVKCTLDWDKRYDRMQNHSAEHVLTGVIHGKFGLDNVGFHLSDDGPVTLDLNGTISYEEVMAAEISANKVVYANYPITASFPTRDEIQSIDYRSKMEIAGQVRLITIGDETNTIDICACCAPHVARTGEIGIIKVISAINWKGGIRISMLAGRRALEYINYEHELLGKASSVLSTNISNVPEYIERHKDEIAELKNKLIKAYESNALLMINSSPKEVRYIFMEAECPPVVMKDIYNALNEKSDSFVAVFSGSDELGYRFYAGNSNGKLDSRVLADKLKKAFNAGGGGSSEMIQGKVNAGKDELSKFFDEL